MTRNKEEVDISITDGEKRADVTLLAKIVTVQEKGSNNFRFFSAVRLGLCVLARCAFRPPRVVFVLGLVSLINSLTSGKNEKFSHFWQKNDTNTRKLEVDKTQLY